MAKTREKSNGVKKLSAIFQQQKNDQGFNRPY